MLIVSCCLLNGPSLATETPQANRPVESAVCHDIDYVTRSDTKCINIDEANIVVFTKSFADDLNSTNPKQRDLALLFLARPATVFWARDAFEKIKSIETYSKDGRYCRMMTNERFWKLKEPALRSALNEKRSAKTGDLPEVLAMNGAIRYLWSQSTPVQCRKLSKDELDYLLN